MKAARPIPVAAPCPEPLGIFGPASALALLWEKASPAMDTRTLQWFADGAGNQVATQTMHLSGWLGSLACLVSQDHTVGSFQSAESTGGLLFSLAHQVDGLHGMAEIAADANYRLRERLGEQP
nr:hypothetical protein [uncultured Albidiferax sp.]